MKSLTHALFDLASRQGYVQPLREEAEAVIRTEGWTKLALNKMVKLDSFIKESQRHSGLTSRKCSDRSVGRQGYLRLTPPAVSINRKALKPFTFSDGTHIPQGTFFNVAVSAIHHDETKYSDPDTFDGFRFANMREVSGESHRHHMVTATTESLHFGFGKHTWYEKLSSYLFYYLSHFPIAPVGSLPPHS